MSCLNADNKLSMAGISSLTFLHKALSTMGALILDSSSRHNSHNYHYNNNDGKIERNQKKKKIYCYQQGEISLILERGVHQQLYSPDSLLSPVWDVMGGWELQSCSMTL